MAGQYLMEKGPATMNVAQDKLAEYLADGWKIVKMPKENKAVVVDQPVVEFPEDPKVPEVPEAPEVKNVMAPDPEPLPVDEVVKKIGKKSRRG